MNLKKSLVALAIFLIPLAVVLLVLVLREYGPPRPVKLTAERKVELLRDKSVTLGELDNGNFDAALPVLETIVREMPDEPFGHRNLVIALFSPSPLSNDSTLAAKETERIQRLLTTTEQMLQLDQGSAAGHSLAGRVFTKLAELTRVSDPAKGEEYLIRAKREFAEAARLAPQDPAPMFELYELESRFGDPEMISEEALKSLRAAHARSPENLYALLELLKRLMERKDPERFTIVEQVLRLLPGDLDTIQEGARPRQSIEMIAELLRQNPDTVPPAALEQLTLARSQLERFFGFYQRDRSRLKPHALEFVLEDFRPSFYADLPLDAEPAIEVRFTEVKPPAGTPTDILMARREDLLSNDAYATLLLRHVGSKSLVETLPSESDQVKLQPLEVDGLFAAFQLADLDLDIKAPKDGQSKKNIPADLDLILHGDAGVRLVELQDDSSGRRWVDRTADCKLPPLSGVRWLLNCDMDHDGNLDVVLGLAKGVRILRNRGAWAFDDVTGRSTGLDGLETQAGVFGDFDRDGDLDFVLVGRQGELLVLDNRRGGRFDPRETGVRLEGATCLSTADVNADGRLDFILGFGQGAAILLGDTSGFPVVGARRLDLPGPRTALVGVIDFDNDGWPDVWQGSSEAAAPALRLFRNLQGRRFDQVTSILPSVSGPVRSVQATDFDAEGDLDLVVVQGPGQLTLLRNDGGNKNHWLRLRLQAELNVDAAGSGQAVKSNFRGIGGTAELRAGRHYQMQQITDTVTHFGLGPRQQVDLVRAIWTNGVPQAAIRPKIDETLVENQRAKGSCPFLFTWDGDRFVFVTDCLWSSALGMKLAHGVDMNHDRQHNYLVFPDEKLRPRDGKYNLRFTNELWEVPYLDVVQLWAIDHPADVEIFTNQRIPPDPKEDFQLLTARDRRYPRTARDHHNRDVLSILSRRDGHYLGGFRRTRYVGLAEPHWVELNLGDLSQARAATLFLTGWIWPTDTSGNIAISQDPRFVGPTGVIGGAQPPSLLVPDGQNGWKTAIPMMGFQSGKLQSVAVPLPLAAFPKGDYRVRIATSMELYWDELFFTVDEAPAAHVLTRLPVAEANLRYRGYSRVLHASPSSPHLYDYDDVDLTPRWLPTRGRYVRYGPVAELLHEPDSCYVVMSPGDELALEFTAPPAPRPGWKRSFVFYGNGWLKDFDMNGNAGDHIGPYPFDGMSRYPYVAPEKYPADGPRARFLAEFLTREEPFEPFWTEVLRGPGKPADRENH